MAYFNFWNHYFPAVQSANFLYTRGKAVAGLNAIELVENNDVLHLSKRHFYTTLIKVYMERSN